MTAPGRPTRLLLVTNMYPTPDRPQDGPFVARRVASLRARGVEVVVAGPSSYRRGAALRHLQIAWRALTARGPFDGVEAHPLYAAGVIGLLVARLRRRPMVAYAHGSDVSAEVRRGRVARSLIRWVAGGAAIVVANSAGTARDVARLGASARVVSPGVDMTLFSPVAGPRQEQRLALGLPEGPTVLFVGHLSDYKGADVFADGLEIAEGWQGVAIGSGPLSVRLRAEHPRVRWPGVVAPEDVPKWLRAADVVAVPSRREGLGLAAVEALACGTPVVASAVGGLTEVVRDGENGLLVPPGDPSALAAALARLEDPDLRARLGAAGPASVAGHDSRAAAAAMAEVWAELGVQT
ncbi:MAG: glycosyltransferase [Candidatus Limnocylindrales bacterium]